MPVLRTYSRKAELRRNKREGGSERSSPDRQGDLDEEEGCITVIPSPGQSLERSSAKRRRAEPVRLQTPPSPSPFDKRQPPGSSNPIDRSGARSPRTRQDGTASPRTPLGKSRSAHEPRQFSSGAFAPGPSTPTPNRTLSRNKTFPGTALDSSPAQEGLMVSPQLSDRSTRSPRTYGRSRSFITETTRPSLEHKASYSEMRSRYEESQPEPSLMVSEQAGLSHG
jgi:hypothetical protein